MIDEQRGLELAGLALTSKATVTLNIKIPSLWLIVSALQLVVASPDLGEPLKKASEGVGRGLQELIAAELPEVEELLEAGWHREHDWIESEWSDGDDEDDWLDDDDGGSTPYGESWFDPDSSLDELEDQPGVRLIDWTDDESNDSRITHDNKPQD